MAVYGLIFKRAEPIRIRFQAFLNLFCVLYMATVTVSVTLTGYFHVLPTCYSDTEVTWHRLAIVYLFISVVGQFVTCASTTSGVRDEHIRTFTVNNVKSKPGKTVKREFLHASNTETRIVSEKEETSGRYPLDSIHYCTPCNLIVPARTHHCLLCKECVIKRDHHCFFMGVCIGRNNHLYFIYFTLYMGIGTFYGLLLLAKYMFFMYGVRFYGPQTFLTLFLNTMLSLINGSIPSLGYLVAFVELYLSLFGSMCALCFFFWHLYIVSRGQTSFEARRGINKYTKGSRMKNFREVFTAGSLVLLLVPFWGLLTTRGRQIKQA